MTAAPPPPAPSRRPLAGCLLIFAALASLYGGLCFSLSTGIAHALRPPAQPPPPPAGLLGLIPDAAFAVLFPAALACIVSGVVVWSTAKISVRWTRIFLIALMAAVAAVIISINLLEARSMAGQDLSADQQFSGFVLVALEAILVAAWIVALRRRW